MPETTIKVGGMRLPGCVRNATGVLQALPGVAEVLLDAGEARVRHDPAQSGVAALKSAIPSDTGFDATWM